MIAANHGNIGFTPEGWTEFGQKVYTEAKKEGFRPKLRRKQVIESSVYYDKYQVAEDPSKVTPGGGMLFSDPFSAAFQLLPSLFARATSGRPGPDPSNPSLPSLTENTFDYMLRISRLYELSETANVAFHEVLDNLETNEGFEWGERGIYLQEFEQGATPGSRAREFMNEVSERGVAAAIRALDRRINAPLTEVERQRMMDSARDDSMQRQAERAVGRRPAETPAGIEIPQGRGESGVAAAPTGPDQPSAFGTPQTETDVDTSDIDDLLREIEELTDDNDGGTTLYSDPFSATFAWLANT